MCLESTDWGNVAEWAAAIAATGTGILLWFTLKEQRKVTSEQQKVTYLQQLKFIYDIRPNFELLKFGAFNQFSLILKKNVAINLEIINGENGYDGMFIERDKIEYPIINRSIEILKGDPFNVAKEKEIEIHVFFQDELGYKYWQWIHGSFPDLVLDPLVMIDENDDPIKMTPPELKQFG